MSRDKSFRSLKINRAACRNGTPRHANELNPKPGGYPARALNKRSEPEDKKTPQAYDVHSLRALRLLRRASPHDRVVQGDYFTPALPCAVDDCSKRAKCCKDAPWTLGHCAKTDSYNGRLNRSRRTEAAASIHSAGKRVPSRSRSCAFIVFFSLPITGVAQNEKNRTHCCAPLARRHFFQMACRPLRGRACRRRAPRSFHFCLHLSTAAADRYADGLSTEGAASHLER